MTKRNWLLVALKIACAAAATAIVIYLVVYARTGTHFNHMKRMNDRELSAYLQSFGSFAIVVGSLAVLLQTWVPYVPFVLLAGANVLVFGFKTGFLINYSMSCLGATLAFLFARYVAHDWIAAKMAKYPTAMQVNALIEKRGFLIVLLGRILFFVPSTAINLGAGVSRMRIMPYVLGTMLGKLPIVLLESMIGHDLFHLKKYGGRLAVLLLVLVVLVAVGTWIKKRYTVKRIV
ncbi:MAG: TVP38/TMEM64 family protein [Paenibacillaceae bacterium]|nr:TVP38/TMEM64 family protein [Paenibacillaceae bacterium]